MSPIFWASFGVLWLIVLFQGAVLVEVVQKLADHRAANAMTAIGADPLPPGTPAPAFEAPLVENGSVLDSRSLRGRRVLLAFTAPGCPSCESTFDSTLLAARHLDAETVVVCRGPRDACREFARRHLPDGATVWDVDGDVAKLFRVHGAPVSVALDEQWHVIKYGAPSPGDVPVSLPTIPSTPNGSRWAAS